MSFRSWLLTETILVKYFNAENGLFPTEGPAMEFNYQWEQGYSSFFIGCYQAKRPGYVSISSRPTHIGIIKTSPIEHGVGIDIGFINNLSTMLSQKGFKSVPYKEVGTAFSNLFQKINYEPEFSPDTGWQTGGNTPDIELGASNMQKLSPGISASKESGSWAYFIEANEPQYYIPKILEVLGQAADPLIKNNLIDFYEISDRRGGRQKFVQSEKGKKESDDWKSKDSRAASQIKYLAMNLLNDAPNFQKKLIRTVGTEDLKGGGKGWFGYEAQPQNFNLPIEQLYELNKRSFSDDSVIRIFLDAVRSGDKEKFQQLEYLTQWADNKKQTTVGQKYTPYYLGGVAERLSWFWNKDKTLQSCIDEPLEYINDIYSILKDADILEQLEPEEFNYWKNQVKNALEEAIHEAEHIYPHQIHDLNIIAGQLGLHPSIVNALEQQDQKIKDEKIQREKIQRESALKRSFLMPVDAYAYMMINDPQWKSIPQKFLNYSGRGNYDIKIGELAEDLIDTEGPSQDAIEAAEEDAQNDVQERPSESYGQDMKEVEQDIEYDWDDFVNANTELAEETDENTPDYEIVKIIKEKYLDDFIEWKKKEMQKDEETKSWKYEVDTESSDFQEKVWEYQREFAEQYAWDEGLVIITRPDLDKVEIQLHKKHWNTFKPLLKRTIDINLSEEDEEEKWKPSTKISIDFIPEGGFTKPAYDLR